MPKADGDPRSRDVAGAGRSREDAPAAPSNAEPSNVKSAPSATHEEVIPPLHVLEAAQTQDRKEAEELLAGFDRPGRSPKVTPKERDFVDYYARKKGEGGPESGSGRPAKAGAAAAALGPRQVDVATVIKARKRRDDVPPWFVWTVAAAFMLLIGGVVAYLGTEDSRPRGAARPAPSAPTTITASPFPRASTENVPPPEPVAAGTTTTPIVVTEPAPAAPATDSPPRGATRRDPSGVSASGASAAAARAPRATGTTDGTKPPPRDDFIRDL
jgi:hypothetical protein